MLRRVLIALLLTLAFVPWATAASPHHKPPVTSSVQLAQFDTAAAAQAHCRREQVVWLNTNSGIYHEKGMRWYGRTKYGA
jgi:hypothetical protein